MDEESVIRLRNAIMRTGRRLRTTAADEGLTATQSGVLATLVREGPMRAGDLASAEAINPTMLSRVVAHLAEVGLVERAPHPGDARCASIRATPAGARLLTRLRARRAAILLGRLEELDPAHLEALASALPALEALARVDEAHP
jgi:DNA-binding MarR family transcriptional regulator